MELSAEETRSGAHTQVPERKVIVTKILSEVTNKWEAFRALLNIGVYMYKRELTWIEVIFILIKRSLETFSSIPPPSTPFL